MADSADEEEHLLGMDYDKEFTSEGDIEATKRRPPRHKARVASVFVLAVLGAAVAAVVAVNHVLEPLAAIVPQHSGPKHAGEYLGRASVNATGDALVGGTPDGINSRSPITFYVYRAQSAESYPLENMNAADLAGVMWYLHNEVVVSTPRKYQIDRIRRFKVTLKNTQEFWNVHHRNFGAFLAFDAARCTTPICGKIFSQYGFIVGCQVLPTDVAPYLGKSITRVDGQCKGDYCNAPVWYSLPGPCPIEGLANNQIRNNGAQDVTKAKSKQCLKEQPGGRCDNATGAPDCTYSYERAGEIMLDELVGIKDYNDFWNGSFVKCAREVKEGTRKGPCYHQHEFDIVKDKGVGCSFWDGKADAKKAAARMKAVRDLFKKHYPDEPYDFKEPACDFDMYYDGEFDWPTNHTGAAQAAQGFSWQKAQDMRKTMVTPAPKKRIEETCEVLGCGERGHYCDCNSDCHKYHDCCKDYSSKCQAQHKQLNHSQTQAGAHAEKRNRSSQEEEFEAHATVAKQNATVAKQSATVAKQDAIDTEQVASACKPEARMECNVAIVWAMNSGIYEHPDWYPGLSGSSKKDEFEKVLAKMKEGSCDKVCGSEVDEMRFLLD